MNEHPGGGEPLEPPGDQAFRRRGPDELHHMQPEMTWGGALSFLRRPYSRDPAVLAAADVVVTGIPFDMATSNRPGARLGPRAIRAASTSIAELPAYPWGFDPFATIAAVDYGDCWFDWGYPTHAVERIEAHTEAILDTDSKMVSLGGDHFVTYPILRAHARRHGPMALIHFDAHSDTWSDDGERLDHGSMFLRAAREGIVDPSRSVQVGIRTHNGHDHGYTVLGAPWVHREGIGAVLEVVHEIVGDHPAYLTFDIDCLDPAFAPGTGTPVVGGLTTAQALDAVRGLGDLDIRGADVVEVAPAYDVSEITAYAAAQLMHDVICLWAIGAGAEPGPTGRT